jgi:signal transduction histidine kinase
MTAKHFRPTAQHEKLSHPAGMLETRDELVNYLRHDFRAPLASITAVLDQLMREPQTVLDDRQKAMRQMRGLVERALDLSEQMLLLSRAGGPASLRCKPVTLGEVVDQACSDVQLKHQANQISVRLSLDLDVMVMGDYSLLYRAVLNLVDNAMRYSPKGSAVGVRLTACQGRAILTVRDHGPGLAHQPDAAEKRGGLGWGLRLVRRVAAAHEGCFSLTNALAGGARALLLLPQLVPAPQRLRLAWSTAEAELAAPRRAGWRQAALGQMGQPRTPAWP